jgi:hypothetical protein
VKTQGGTGRPVPHFYLEGEMEILIPFVIIVAGGPGLSRRNLGLGCLAPCGFFARGGWFDSRVTPGENGALPKSCQ